MSLESSIESVVINHYDEILSELNVTVRGAWAKSSELLNEEDAEDIAFLDIKVSPAYFPSYQTPVGEWSVSVALVVPMAIDPGGEYFEAIWDRLSDDNLKNQMRLSSVKAAFTSPGVFFPHGYLANGGSAPEFVDGKHALSFSFTLRGVFAY